MDKQVIMDGKEKKQARPSQVLNEYQKNSLTVMFRLIEETLNRIEPLLRSENEDNLMYTIHNPYTPQEREAILRIFKSFRTRLAEGKRMFQFEKVDINLRSIMVAEMSILWEQLVDSQADKLRRYGKVAPEAKGVVDPIIKGLIQDILDIFDIGRSKER